MKNLVAILTVVFAIIVIWYGSAYFMNKQWTLDQAERAGVSVSASDVFYDTMAQERPQLPAPHQVFTEIWKTTVEKKITSKRSLIFHAGVTLSSTSLGFAMGSLLGIILAIGIVHSRAMDLSVMPWIIASQTIPILAVAPMIIVVLNAIGISGLIPKAMISMYLSFFPVAVGMVKGLRAPDAMQLDLMKTYRAGSWQTLIKLRLPTSMPYLFTSLKIAMAASLVGAIIGELPTGAVAGLGARLLAGSYYGQTIQIWSALISAAVLAALLVMLIGVLQKITLKRMGMTQ
jgi:NitT/TauT family transport system permease protein